MAGNIFGHLFRVTTFGESHGAAIGAVLDGVPPGLELSLDDIQRELNRRRPGQSDVTTPRKESDQAEILSGIFEGKTTGTPLAILIRNADQRSKDYSSLLKIFRPGHADFTMKQKFGVRDHRGGGRSSGRETACRVAAGAVAKKILITEGVSVLAYTTKIGGIAAREFDPQEIERNAVRAADPQAAREMIDRIHQVKDQGDSVGGIIEVRVNGLPAGLGDPVFDKLDARLAAAVMSIGAIKGVEFGDGFKAAEHTGAENNDAFIQQDGRIVTATNHAGGILGGISTGTEIILRAAVKPTSSISRNQTTVDQQGSAQEIQIEGRHDPCLCPRIVPVIEAMVALVLADCLLIQKSVN